MFSGWDLYDLALYTHGLRSGSVSSQSCSKRTPMSNTTERFPVLAGTEKQPWYTAWAANAVSYV